MIETSWWTVAIAASITAITTGLGALPFFFVEKLSRRWLAIGNAIAGGLMLGASHGLIQEGFVYSPIRTIAGILVGVAFIAITQRQLDNQHHFSVGELRGADALKALMIVGVMTLHSFSEGVGVGVSFGGGQDLGALITIAIAVHNIPEGLAISLVLVPRGTSPWRAAGWSIFSSLPQPIMAVPAFLFVTVFQPFLPVGLGVAGGAMIWMVVAELIPDALEDSSGSMIATILALAFAGMLAFQAFL
ncbi:MAG: ZIP family metal transporter [Anaerolineales bacterium]